MSDQGGYTPPATVTTPPVTTPPVTTTPGYTPGYAAGTDEYATGPGYASATEYSSTGTGTPTVREEYVVESPERLR